MVEKEGAYALMTGVDAPETGGLFCMRRAVCALDKGMAALKTGGGSLAFSEGRVCAKEGHGWVECVFFVACRGSLEYTEGVVASKRAYLP